MIIYVVFRLVFVVALIGFVSANDLQQQFSGSALCPMSAIELSIFSNANNCGCWKFSQPPVYEFVYHNRHQAQDTPESTTPCLFQRIDTSTDENLSNENNDTPSDHFLELYEASSIPDDQVWSHCKRSCAFVNQSFHILISEDTGTGITPKAVNISSSISLRSINKIKITWSQWGEFFHNYKHDIISLQGFNTLRDFKSPELLVYHIRTPVYVLPMITFHVGHILIDLMEQLYHNMMHNYGEIRLDSLLVIDASNIDELSVMLKKLFVNTEGDPLGTVCSLLTAFTNHPILSMDLFRTLNVEHVIIFEDIHFGLDLRQSFFHVGYRYHPCIFNLKENQPLQRLSSDYKKFRSFVTSIIENRGVVANQSSWLQSFQQAPIQSSSSKKSKEYSSLVVVNVLFILREFNRVILNFEDLQARICSNSTISSRSGQQRFQINCMVQDIDKLSLREQLDLFYQTDIMIGTAGTAMHNMLFLRPNSVTIIFMQPGWCDWAWMYVNQAVLLDIKPLVYCSAYPNYHLINSTAGSGGLDEGELIFSNHFVNPHWTRKFSKQGPRMSKNANITVNIGRSYELFETALYRRFAMVQDMICSGLRKSRLPRDNQKGVMQAKQYTLLNQITNYTFQPLKSIRVIDLYVSDLKITSFSNDDNNGNKSAVESNLWKIAIMGEFGMEFHRIQLFDHFPYLSICLTLPLVLDRPACYPLSDFNYLSAIMLTMTKSRSNVHVHLWAQSMRHGGKFQGSDAFISISTGYSDGGLHLQQQEILNLTLVYNVSIGLLRQYVTEFNPLKDEDVTLSTTLLRNLLRPNFTDNNAVPFYCYIATRLSFQKCVIEFCYQHDLVTIPGTCSVLNAYLTNEIAQLVLARQLKLPMIQVKPTPESPFIFLHVEKSAGTTLREFIFESAEKLGLRTFVPCHGGIHCVTLDLVASDRDPCIPQNITLENISVVAGHFFWGVWNNLPSFSRVSRTHDQTAGIATKKSSLSTTGLSQLLEKGVTAESINSKGAPPPCLVMGRNPIDRAISYYYQRCYEGPTCIGYQRRINDLSPDELLFIAMNERQGNYKADNVTLTVIDEGVSDGACRTIGNFKRTTGLVAGIDDLKIPDALTPEEMEVAWSNIDHCVVGMIDRWEETKVVIHHWFPWIDFSENSNRQKMRLYIGKETSATLRPELVAVLQSINQCDLKLYEKMQYIFEKEISVVNSATFLSR